MKFKKYLLIITIGFIARMILSTILESDLVECKNKFDYADIDYNLIYQKNSNGLDIEVKFKGNRCGITEFHLANIDTYLSNKHSNTFKNMHFDITNAFKIHTSHINYIGYPSVKSVKLLHLPSAYITVKYKTLDSHIKNPSFILTGILTPENINDPAKNSINAKFNIEESMVPLFKYNNLNNLKNAITNFWNLSLYNNITLELDKTKIKNINVNRTNHQFIGFKVDNKEFLKLIDISKKILEAQIKAFDIKNKFSFKSAKTFFINESNNENNHLHISRHIKDDKSVIVFLETDDDHNFHLISHECMHRFIPFTLQVDEKILKKSDWYDEGFNDYLAVILNSEYKISNYSKYLRCINNAIELYHLDKHNDKYNFNTGFLLAFLIDNDIREQTHDKYNILDLFKVLLKKVKDGSPYTLSLTDFDESYKSLGIDKKISLLITDIIKNNKEIILPEKIFGSRLLINKPTLGFKYDKNRMIIEDVDIYSQAYRKGIRNGQKLYEVMSNNRSADIKIYENDEKTIRKISYPKFSQEFIPRYYSNRTKIKNIDFNETKYKFISFKLSENEFIKLVKINRKILEAQNKAFNIENKSNFKKFQTSFVNEPNSEKLHLLINRYVNDDESITIFLDKDNYENLNLISHEYMRRFIPFMLDIDRKIFKKKDWYQEGFNDYLATILNLEYKIIEYDQYLKTLNDKIEINNKVDNGYNINIGFLLAFLIDNDIREQTQNKCTILDLFKVLLKKVQDQVPYTLSLNDFDEAYKGLGINKKVSLLITDIIKNNKEIILPEKVFGLINLINTPTLGFKYDTDKMIVKDVDIYSQAYKKGIRNGQKIYEVISYHKSVNIKIYENDRKTIRKISYSKLSQEFIPRYYKAN